MIGKLSKADKVMRLYLKKNLWALKQFDRETAAVVRMRLGVGSLGGVRLSEPCTFETVAEVADMSASGARNIYEKACRAIDECM